MKNEDKKLLKAILEKIWLDRNPQHELNADSEEDMFFDTVIMVIEDYNNEVKNRNLLQGYNCPRCDYMEFIIDNGLGYKDIENDCKPAN